MSQKRIENEFDRRLGNYASIIDEDQLWSEIESRVPQKKKKRRLFIWFSMGFSVLLVGLIIFWLPSNVGINTVELLAEDKSSNQYENDFIEQNENILSIRPEVEEPNVTTENAVINDKAANQQILESNQSTDLIEDADLNYFYSSEDRIANAQKGKIYDKIEEARNEIVVQKINGIPVFQNILSISEASEIEISKQTRRKKRSIKPLKETRSFVGLSYYAGMIRSQAKMAGQDSRQINAGSDYFSHGLSITYGRFITSRIYGRFILSADKSYKKFSEKISRDTLVPSSNGDQIISYTQYSNGVIDTESGIPIVKGTYSRGVINLNTITSTSIGVGLGYEQVLGRFKVNLEADYQRSFYHSFKGLGLDSSEDKIRDLDSFENYFSYAPKHALNTQLNLDFALNNTLSLIGGIQHQLGMTSILIDQTGHEEKLNLMRGSLGLKMIL